MIKDHVTLGRTFGKYRIVIPTSEEWEKNWLNQLRKGHVWFTDGDGNQQGTGQEFVNTKEKYSGTFHWDRMIQSFRQNVTLFLFINFIRNSYVILIPSHAKFILFITDFLFLLALLLLSQLW